MDTVENKKVLHLMKDEKCGNYKICRSSTKIKSLLRAKNDHEISKSISKELTFSDYEKDFSDSINLSQKNN